MKPARTTFTRRRLLQGSAFYGLGAVVPPLLLTACGGGSESSFGAFPGGPGNTGDGATPGSGAREKATLNFDLSYAPIAEPQLQLYNSSSHGAPLMAHTADTRVIQRQLNPALRAVPDERLTHYVEAVDFPARALQLGAIVGKHVKTGAAVVATTFLRVPSASVAKVKAKRQFAPLVDKQPRGQLRAPPPLLTATTPPPIIDMHSAPLAIATALIFQHPAITNLNPDLGADIVDRINSLPSAANPYIGELAYAIAILLEKGYPTTADIGSWAILVPRVDPSTGQPILDEDGVQIYSYTINNVLAPTVASVVKQILNNINNDATFQGSNWQPSVGAPEQAAAASTAAARVGQAVASASVFQVNHSLKIGSRTSGIRFKSIVCSDDRSVGLTVSNEFLRSASVYVQYLDGAGNALAVDNPDALDTYRSKYVNLISPDVQIMGIPFLGNNAPTTNLNFTMPDAAVQAILYYGGLGLGGADAFKTEAIMGTIATLVINLGLPSICLAFGLYDDLKNGLASGIEEALKDASVAKLVKEGFVEALAGGLGSSIQTATTTLSLQAFLAGIADTVIDIFFAASPLMAKKLAAYITAAAAQKAIPIVGEALWLASAIADVATLGETIVECLSCPAVDKNTISLSMAQTASVSHDPNNFQFPATATHYKLTATYDGAKAPQSVTGTIPQGTVGPLDLFVGNVASGGKVYAEIFFYNAQECLVGYGKSDTLVNLPATAAAIPITIKEYLVPLDATTKYIHSLKLNYVAGAHSWDSTAAAPTATVLSLQPGVDNTLGALHGITVHTASGQAGYGFAAGGQNIPLCQSGSSSGLSVLRNVFLGHNPDTSAKFSSCGSSQPMGIVYQPNSAITNGNNFFLQSGSDGFYHLRGVTLDNSNFNMNQPLSWGRFMNAMDSLCVLTNGFVIGVNRDTHKMEVLRLPQQPDTPTDESDSVPFSAVKLGWGSQQGLLDTPVAVCAFGAYALVLEQGNTRVQAFDQDGTATQIFTDSNGVANNTALMQLKDGSDSSIVYLDIAVEGAGYIYVLSYANGGRTPDDYHLDVYTPTGAWLSRTSGVAAGAIAVDLFRNVYSLNYEMIAGTPQVEPSLSQWLPQSSTPCAQTGPAVSRKVASSAVPVGVCAAVI